MLYWGQIRKNVNILLFTHCSFLYWHVEKAGEHFVDCFKIIMWITNVCYCLKQLYIKIYHMDVIASRIRSFNWRRASHYPWQMANKCLLWWNKTQFPINRGQLAISSSSFENVQITLLWWSSTLSVRYHYTPTQMRSYFHLKPLGNQVNKYEMK